MVQCYGTNTLAGFLGVPMFNFEVPYYDVEIPKMEISAADLPLFDFSLLDIYIETQKNGERATQSAIDVKSNNG